MARKGYIIHNQQAVYYRTFTVAGWINIFNRQSYRDVVIECSGRGFAANQVNSKFNPS